MGDELRLLRAAGFWASGWSFRRRSLWPASLLRQLRLPSSNSDNTWNLQQQQKTERTNRRVESFCQSVFSQGELVQKRGEIISCSLVHSEVYLPGALLIEALLTSSCHSSGSFGMHLADFVFAMVLFGAAQVRRAPFHLKHHETRAKWRKELGGKSLKRKKNDGLCAHCFCRPKKINLVKKLHL
jgi:hypothetical protein